MEEVETVEEEVTERKGNCVVKYVSTESLQEYTGIIIPTSENDYNSLKADIAKNNIRQPLHVCKRTVLAGNTRLRVARDLGLPFVPCLNLPVDMSALDQKEYAISDNLSRRHLTIAQKADLALQLSEIEKEKARKRQLATLKQNAVSAVTSKANGTDENPLNPDTSLFGVTEEEKKGEALKIAAERAGVSYSTAYKAKKIHAENPELYKEVVDGHRSIDEGYKIVMRAPKSEKLFNPHESEKSGVRTNAFLVEVKKIRLDFQNFMQRIITAKATLTSEDTKSIGTEIGLIYKEAIRNISDNHESKAA